MSSMAASDAIVKALKRAPKRGLTAQEIAERVSLNLNTTRTTIWALNDSGVIAVVGTVKPTGPGRPANRYALTA